MKFPVVLLYYCVFIVAGCSKDKINVSEIYPTDAAGNIMGSTPNDNQWKQQAFSDNEMALFHDLDTTDLSGTILPVVNASYPAFPNPYMYTFGISVSFNQPFDGDVVVKYVIVNKNLSPIVKKSFRTTISAGYNLGFLVGDNINSGNYRFYYTLSAKDHDHFFKSWGNIKKQ